MRLVPNCKGPDYVIYVCAFSIVKFGIIGVDSCGSSVLYLLSIFFNTLLFVAYIYVFFYIKSDFFDNVLY